MWRTCHSEPAVATRAEDSPTVRRVADEDARTTVAEDLALMRSVQGGLSSRGYRPDPLVIDPGMGLNSEHTVAAIKAWYVEAMRPAARGRIP
ncbi:MAG: hypothetical protein J4G11_10290 [Acidimicrobiia bacterium]|nr:hypothetical protein [Acidimicrobiia bacterium]